MNGKVTETGLLLGIDVAAVLMTIVIYMLSAYSRFIVQNTS